MIIQHCSIQNPYIHYDDISLSVPETGITYLLGKNGSGKTTLLRHILYGNPDILFRSEQEKLLFNTARYRLFAYVPQKIETADLSVSEFLFRDNPEADQAAVPALLRRFSLEEIDLDTRVYRLSGGEKIKLALISALIRNTPYLILDEPSNHLDNQSTLLLRQLLAEVSESRAVLLSTHDERLLGLPGTSYLLTGRECLLKETAPAESFSPEPPAAALPRRNILSLLKKRFRSSADTSSRVLMGFLLMTMFGIFQMVYSNNFDYTEKPKPGIVLCHSRKDVYTGWSRLYDKAYRLSIPEKSYSYIPSLSDIPAIAAHADKTYVFDEQHYIDFTTIEGVNALREPLSSLTDQDRMMLDFIFGQEPSPEMLLDRCTFSLPEFLSEDDVFMTCVGLKYLGMLSEGRYPLDRADEIVLSERILRQYFGLEEEQPSDYLGKTVSLGEHPYTIVGLCASDLCLISHREEDAQHGIYLYSEDSFEQFLSEHSESYIFGPLETNLFLFTDSEENMLQQLVPEYPACEYYSRHFLSVTEKMENREIFKTYWWLYFLAPALLGLCFFASRKYVIERYAARAECFGSYYLNPGELYALLTKKELLRMLVILPFAAGFFVLSFWVFWLGYFEILPQILFLLPWCYAVLYLPSGLYALRLLKRRQISLSRL